MGDGQFPRAFTTISWRGAGETWPTVAHDHGKPACMKEWQTGAHAPLLPSPAPTSPMVEDTGRGQ